MRLPSRQGWRAMVSRCHNPQDKDFVLYGARGIEVCARWRSSFSAFAMDVGEKPSPLHMLDRINNDGNYEPGNVRWATPTEQARNRRNTIRLTAKGKTQVLVEWARETGIPYTAMLERLGRGWTHEAIVSTPVGETEVPITFDGETLSIAEWAKRIGVPKGTLWNRIRKFHWPLERALSPGDKRRKEHAA